MISPNIFVRLADVAAMVETGTLAITELPVFTLHDGYESNEAGIPELRDASGNLIEIGESS